jgi:hypothetical protein
MFWLRQAWDYNPATYASSVTGITVTSRSSFFCCCSVVGFELRTSCLRGRHATTWATPSALVSKSFKTHFCYFFFYFSKFSHYFKCVAIGFFFFFHCCFYLLALAQGGLFPCVIYNLLLYMHIQDFSILYPTSLSMGAHCHWIWKNILPRSFMFISGRSPRISSTTISLSEKQFWTPNLLQSSAFSFFLFFL